MCRLAILVIAAAGLLAAGDWRGIALAADQSRAPATLNRQQIYQAAKARKDAVKNVRLQYEVSLRQLLKVPSLKAENLALDLLPYRILFAMDGERRKLWSEPILPNMPGANDVWFQKGIDPRPCTTIFDGSRCIVHSRDSVAVITRNKDPRCEQKERYVSAALGIPVTDAARAQYDNDWFYPHCLRGSSGQGPAYRVLPETEEVNGAPCHVVVAEGFDKIWVDPELGCAVRKRERYFSPETPYLVTRETHTDFVQSGGIWVPKTVVEDVFSPLSNPKEYWNKQYLEVTLRVSEIAINGVADDDFKLLLPAGSYVEDRTAGRLYEVPGDKTDALSDLAKEGANYAALNSTEDSRPRILRQIFVVGINALVVLIVVGAVLIRALRKRSAASSKPSRP